MPETPSRGTEAEETADLAPAADPARPRGRRRQGQVPPSGTIDFFSQGSDGSEAQPPAVSSADLMALTRELRRLQSWTPDSPETRDALRAILETALAQSLSGVQSLILPLIQTQETAAASLVTLIREAAEEAVQRTRATDATLKSVELRSQAIADATTAATNQVDAWLKRTAEQVGKMINEPWWRRLLPPLGAAGLCGAVMILLLTALRPGWTLTRDQMEALRIGESVSRIYLSAPPKEQAEMRRVNRWRSPTAADTTTAPPQRQR